MCVDCDATHASRALAQLVGLANKNSNNNETSRRAATCNACCAPAPTRYNSKSVLALASTQCRVRFVCECCTCVGVRVCMCVLLQTGRSTLPMPAGRPVIYGHAQKVTAKRYNKLPLPPSRGLCAPALLKGSERGARARRLHLAKSLQFAFVFIVITSCPPLAFAFASLLVVAGHCTDPAVRLSLCICVCLCVCAGLLHMQFVGVYVLCPR